MKKTPQGFSLIEILVYVGISSIIILAVSVFFLWILRSNARVKAESDVQDNLRRSMGIMLSEIREAKSVYTPTSLFQNDSGQLSLETTKYFLLGEDVSYIDFYFCQNRLCLKKEGLDPIFLTSDKVTVKKIEFFQIAGTSTAPSIQIVLEMSSFQYSASLISSASIRSH